jgi:hypothetical protein
MYDIKVGVNTRANAERVNVVLGIQTLPTIYFVTKTIPRVDFTKPNITQHRNKIPAFEVASRVAVVT